MNKIEITVVTMMFLIVFLFGIAVGISKLPEPVPITQAPEQIALDSLYSQLVGEQSTSLLNELRRTRDALHEYCVELAEIHNTTCEE